MVVRIRSQTQDQRSRFKDAVLCLDVGFGDLQTE